MINYSEFLTATLDYKHLVTEEKLWMMFKTFDTHDKNFITTRDISLAMSKLGKQMTEEEVKTSMEMHKLSQDDQITFDEFKVIFSEDQNNSED